MKLRRLFFSKNTYQSIIHLEDIFLPKPGYVWFVEFIPRQLWIPENDGILTTDPLNAKQFDTEMKALQYIIKNKLGSNFKPTEHEFVNFKS